MEGQSGGSNGRAKLRKQWKDKVEEVMEGQSGRSNGRTKWRK